MPMLNQPGYHSTAAIAWNVERWGSAELHISDCDRKISLDFTYGDDEYAHDCYDNGLFKLDVLEATIKEFRRELIKARKGWLKQKAKDDAAAKKLAK